jgi:hypothetical protein
MAAQQYSTAGIVVEILDPVTRGKWTSQQAILEIEPPNVGKDGKEWPAKCAVFEILTDKLQWPAGFGIGAQVRVQWAISDRQGTDGRWWQGRRVSAVEVTVAAPAAKHGEEAGEQVAAEKASDDPMPF